MFFLTKLGQLCSSTLLRSAQYQACYFSKIRDDVLPKNLLNDYDNMVKQPPSDKVYDRKPFKMILEKDKVYLWCLCGYSKSQPICDGTHNKPGWKKFIKHKPIKVKVEETKEYWLCNCKQTEHRPFCDGTHRREDIQAKFEFTPVTPRT